MAITHTASIHKVFHEFEENDFFMIYSHHTSAKKIGEPYIDFSFWMHKKKDRFALYLLDGFIGGGGHLSVDSRHEIKYFHDMEDFRRWAQDGIATNAIDKEDMFEKVKNLCIQRNYNQLSEQLIEHHQKSVIKKKI